MPDKMTPQQRHNCMSHIRAKNTKPEVLVRQYLHAEGFRFRIHVKKLPGCPDVVLPKYRTCIFVNGCFWHGHRGCRYATRPKSNAEFWQTKIQNNIRRDELSAQALDTMGWRIITVWECELKKDRREETLRTLAEQIRCNGVAYDSEQRKRRERNAEHRARIKAAKERYESMMAELGLAKNRKRSLPHGKATPLHPRRTPNIHN